MKNYLILFFALTFTFCKSQTEVLKKVKAEKTIQAIPLDPAIMSGLNLKAVKDAKQPNRKLFQRNLYRGPEISVYVVSSESATAYQKSYGLEEFIFLINGGARLRPKDGKEQYAYTGDFFVAPKGYIGEWETIGGTDFHHELSVITTPRNKNEIDSTKIQPVFLDKAKMSGIGITRLPGEKECYRDTMYQGHELTLLLEAEESTIKEITEPLKEQLIYVIAGSIQLTDKEGKSQTFYAGNFFLLPAGFTGKWESKGHHLFRSLSISKTPWKK